MKFYRIKKSIQKSTADIWMLLTLSPRGIDLARRGHEVAKIFYAHFSNQIAREGYDPDDVLQDVYQGIIMRNRGINPYNPEVAKFGHYVHMVCKCVWINYRQKYARHRSLKYLGRSPLSGEYEYMDPASADIEDTRSNHDSTEIDMMLNVLDDDDREIIVDLAKGHTKSHIINKGFSREDIAAAIDRARSLFS